MVRDKVLKAIKADYSEESKLAERVLLDLLESNRRLYSYLKPAYVHGRETPGGTAKRGLTLSY